MFNFKGALMQFPLSGFSLFIVMGTKITFGLEEANVMS